MLGDADAERLGDAVGGDVVVGRADAPGGEDVVELGPHLVQGGDDRLLDIGHHPAFHQPHAQLVQLEGQELQVGVLGAAAQDLVADDQQAGGDGLGRGSGGSVGHFKSLAWPCYAKHLVPNRAA